MTDAATWRCFYPWRESVHLVRETPVHAITEKKKTRCMSIMGQALARSRGERNLARINEGRVLGEVIIEESQGGMARMSPPREELRSTSHEHAAHCANGRTYEHAWRIWEQHPQAGGQGVACSSQPACTRGEGKVSDTSGRNPRPFQLTERMNRKQEATVSYFQPGAWGNASNQDEDREKKDICDKVSRIQVRELLNSRWR